MELIMWPDLVGPGGPSRILLQPPRGRATSAWTTDLRLAVAGLQAEDGGNGAHIFSRSTSDRVFRHFFRQTGRVGPRLRGREQGNTDGRGRRSDTGRDSAKERGRCT